MDYYRIQAHVAPEIEKSLSRYDLDDSLISFFENARVFFNALKHVTIFLIPSEYKSIFNSNRRLKLLKEVLEVDSQSNVFFASVRNDLPCSKNTELLKHTMPSFDDAAVCRKIVIDQLYKRKVPFLIDRCNYNAFKLRCPECVPTKYVCHCEVSLQVASMPSTASLATLSEVIKQNIHHWHFKRDKITGDDLKCLSYLNGLFYEIAPDKLLFCMQFRIYRGFLQDVMGNPSADFSNIAFSMLRAVAYPSSHAPDRQKYSIDWHPNDPARLEGYELVRADVISPQKSGISGSGAERLLLAKKNGAIYFLQYSPTHDFAVATIADRLRDIDKNHQIVFG